MVNLRFILPIYYGCALSNAKNARYLRKNLEHGIGYRDVLELAIPGRKKGDFNVESTGYLRISS